MTNYNFGEKTKEKYKVDGKFVDLEVLKTPKYEQSKQKAIELIESKKYGLDTGDFWILKNKSGSKLCYTGLIISHNGCLKINDQLEKNLRFSPSCVSFVKDEADKIKVMSYINEEQGVYEFGEISPKNCMNDYPYAMVLKRLMDRVILKNSKVGFFGIYSDSESEDFKEVLEEKPKNASGLNPNGELAQGKDMQEKLDKKNEEDFAGLKAIIESCASEEELRSVWLEKQNLKIINSLKKRRPELYDLLVNAKDEMKASFIEEGDDEVLNQIGN